MSDTDPPPAATRRTASAHTVPARTLVVICADWSVRAAGLAGADRPIAVYSHRGIEATNPAARAAGIRVGLRRREAQGRCPEVELVPHDPARDARCFDPVVAALATFTPQVEIVEPGVAAFATRGPSRYFGGDEALAERALDAVRALTTDPPIPLSEVRVGVADGPAVARLAALRTAPGTANVIAPGGAPAFVAPLPLSAIAPFVPDRTVLAVWHQLGLRTLGEVATLPARSVLGRFGSDGIWIHRLAQGIDPTVISSTPLPEDVDEIVDFDPPETRAEAVAFASRAAAGTFSERLERLGLSCAQVVITLATDHAEERVRRWRLDGPGPAGRQPDALIAERVRWQTDGWLSSSAATRPTAGITRVVLAPGEIRPAQGRQVGFWGGASAADERAAQAVARLEALAGPDGVWVIERRGGRHPSEEATLLPTALVGLPTRSGSQIGVHGGKSRTRTGAEATRTGADPPWPGRLPRPSPATVLTRPRPIEVTDTDGVDVEVTGRGELRRAPTAVRFTVGVGRSGDRSATVTGWAGPWPVEERWWDPLRRRRQARLQILTADGDALLVARHDRRWWLHAIYT